MLVYVNSKLISSGSVAHHFRPDATQSLQRAGETALWSGAPELSLALDVAVLSVTTVVLIAIAARLPTPRPVAVSHLSDGSARDRPTRSS